MSHARFDKRPWIFFDFKKEVLLDQIGFPPLRALKVGKLPSKRGLYVCSPRPGQEDEVEDMLWSIWEQGNIGLFCDEVTLMPDKAAFKAIQRQGRSKLIPTISCTQRPVGVDREIFTEANFVSLFNLRDIRDQKVVRDFTGMPLREAPLPRYWSRWYDVGANTEMLLKPAPHADTIVLRLRREVPYTSFFGG